MSSTQSIVRLKSSVTQTKQNVNCEDDNYFEKESTDFDAS